MDELLKGIDPVLAGLVIPAAFLTKWLVTLLRATLLKRWQGNVVQTLTLGISTLFVLGFAAAKGVLSDGVTVQEVWGLILVDCATAASAIGFHEAVSNRNKETP